MKNLAVLIVCSLMCLSCSDRYDVHQQNSYPVVIDGESCNVFYVGRGMNGLYYIKCPSGSSATHTSGKATISTVSTNKIPILDAGTNSAVMPVEAQDKTCNCVCNIQK